MKHVRLIRHGESAANAGEASLDHASIPLTPKGVEQARLVASSFTQAPDLIVASPFSRARATATATVALFSSVPFEIWPTHEFTYLEPARCVNTTVAQRREWVDAYWSRSDPAFTDGKGAESFSDFISRAQAFLHKLAEHPGDDLAVFSHGQFINAVAWLIERKPQQIDGRAMADWRDYEITNHVPNCRGYLLTLHPGAADCSVSQLAPDKPLMCAVGRDTDRVYQAVPDPQRLLVEERATALSAREVSQLLREVTLGRRLITKVGQESWDEVYACHFQVDIDGWRLSICNDCDTLDYCEECVSPEGRRWSFDSNDSLGSDPVALLTAGEHQALARLLKAL